MQFGFAAAWLLDFAAPASAQVPRYASAFHNQEITTNGATIHIAGPGQLS